MPIRWLHSRNDGIGRLVPGIVGRAWARGEHEARPAYVRSGAASTYVVPGDHLAPARATQLLGGGTPAYGPTEGNEIEYLLDGPDTFRAMAEAIATLGRSGSRNVPIEEQFLVLVGWTLEGDLPFRGVLENGSIKTGSSALGEFEEVARRGVKVFVLLWGGNEDYAPAQARNARLLVQRLNELPTVSAKIDLALHATASHHQKILLVHGSEGLIGFYGGVDLDGTRLPGWERSMEDTHARVRGPAALQLLQLVRERWRHADDDAGLASRAVSAVGAALSGPDRPDFPANPAGGARQAGHMSARVMQTVGNPRIHQPSDVRQGVLDAIGAARRFIYLEDQYFWSTEVADAIASVVSSLAHVTILIPPERKKWALSEVILRRRNIARLVAAVPPSQLHKIGIYERFGTAADYIHSKLWIIDDELAIVGSANCSSRSFELDSEVMVKAVDRTRVPWFQVGIGQARRLRIRRWKTHLGHTREELWDGVAAGQIWRQAPPDGTPFASIRHHLITEGHRPPVRWEDVGRIDLEDVGDGSWSAVAQATIARGIGTSDSR